jgi:hypothetical protein
MTMPLNETRTTAADMPRVRQSLALTCAKCGATQSYDVGTIFMTEGATGADLFQFTNYFRCLRCDSPGPFVVADYLKVIAGIMSSKVRKNPKVFLGRVELFDGSMHQTPAMSEEHLKQLIAKDPHSAFLHVRLGNLMRASKDESFAFEWYTKAVALDPHELEALNSLKELLVKRDDYKAALHHAAAILETIGAGRRAGTEELTRGILSTTLYLMNECAVDFRDAWEGQPAEFRDSRSGRVLREFMDLGNTLDVRVWLFVNATLGEAESVEPETDEFEADEEFALAAEPAGRQDTRKWSTSPNLRPIEMEASLAAAVAGAGLDWTGLRPVLPAREDGGVAGASRHTIGLTDGERAGLWQVPSLRALFRGDRQPPAWTEMERYPAEYADLFYCVEYQALLVADADRAPTDEEFIDLYSTMRRRPDGKSLGPLHDAVWQATCLALGMMKFSEAEFDAVFTQLTRSVRHFRIGHPSRNYIPYLRSTFGR